MKKRKSSQTGVSFLGAVLFFFLVAFVMQIAILLYESIRTRTQNKGLIAVLILIAVILLSVSFTAFDYFRRKLTVERHIKKILYATEKIAEGDFSVRLETAHEYGKYNEYDLIAENINVMASELQKTELLKVDFISNVSHEIKTPLAVIQNYAVLLKDASLSEEAKNKHIETLINACKRITDLITNILKLSKLENQEINEKKEKFDLSESVAESVLSFENVIESKNITVECELEESEIFSCKSLLEIVWNNLISNAVKFTDKGGKIKVCLNKEGENVKVTVSDTGCGIFAEVGSHIFEKFYQGDSSHSTQGNGLGLALVKKVIDILGGEISVSSELGKGSTFSVLLKGVVNEKKRA